MTDTASKLPMDPAGQGDAPRDAGSESILKQLGPGLIRGAADDDPSGIATNSLAGALFGFNLAWLMLLTYPLMSAIQMISGRMDRVTGVGLAANLRTIWPRPMVILLVELLFVANTINIGANLSAMEASAELATGLPSIIERADRGYGRSSSYCSAPSTGRSQGSRRLIHSSYVGMRGVGASDKMPSLTSASRVSSEKTRAPQ